MSPLHIESFRRRSFAPASSIRQLGQSASRSTRGEWVSIGAGAITLRHTKYRDRHRFDIARPATYTLHFKVSKRVLAIRNTPSTVQTTRTAVSDLRVLAPLLRAFASFASLPRVCSKASTHNHRSIGALVRDSCEFATHAYLRAALQQRIRHFVACSRNPHIRNKKRIR